MMREVVSPHGTWLDRIGKGLDRAITALSPRWGFRRAQARAATRVLNTAYRSAEKTRLRGDWNPLGGSADADLLPDLATLRERSRDLHRNNAHAAAITGTIVENEIGTGIRPQCRLDRKALGLDNDTALGFERAAERIWKRWAPRADAQNRMSLYEIQVLLKRQIIENGEVLALPLMLPEDRARPLSLALEVLEADRLETPPGRRQDPTIRDGVELGARGEPVAYWIRKHHPGDLLLGRGGVGVSSQTEHVRYPAVNAAGRPNVFHLYAVKRPGQTRGEPFYAPVLDTFKDLGDVIEATVVRERVKACFSAFVTKTNPLDAALGAGGTNGAGQRLNELEPGMMEYLQPGESVTFGDPTGTGDTFDPFVNAMLRSMGAALGLPLELVLKDFSKTNYSSARAALLEARRFFRGGQMWMAQRFCQPVWEMVLDEAWLRELLPPVVLFGDQRDYWVQARWIAPGWGWVDPVKEVESSERAVAANISTLAEECAAQGRDWEEVLYQREREEQLRKELNLPGPADMEPVATPSGPEDPAAGAGNWTRRPTQKQAVIVQNILPSLAPASPVAAPAVVNVAPAPAPHVEVPVTVQPGPVSMTVQMPKTGKRTLTLQHADGRTSTATVETTE